MRFEFINSIGLISPGDWDTLWRHCSPSEYPFTRHAFLYALERSGSTSKETGWQVHHVLGWKGSALCIAMPLYLKSHSYGEYVFDWSWADAYHHHGLDYYPKLLNAIPFTPATGPRLAMCPSLNGDMSALTALHSFLVEFASQQNISSIHSLFPNNCTPWKSEMYTRRTGTQFHWFNNDYLSFDHFLENLSSRKRKNIRKEREKNKGLDITMTPAKAIRADVWDTFYQLYQRTYYKRSGRPGYLGPSFFTDLAKAMPEQLLLAQAKHNDQILAAAVYFRDHECLYGRYWGANDEYDGLHFETCYYLGIDYAIQHKLKRFDPGAQGEHKIQRGFQSVETRSFHWIMQDAFRGPIAQFCAQESIHNQAYLNDARNHLPFKAGVAQVSCDALYRDTT